MGLSEEHMTRGVIVLTVALFAAPLLAQEQVYLYVKHTDAAGESVRYRLECVDLKCTADTKAGKSDITLDDAQKKALLGAVQAEARRFVVAADEVPADELTKVKLRYDTPMKRLEIERRLPAAKSPELTPEMVGIIRTYFTLHRISTRYNAEFILFFSGSFEQVIQCSFDFEISFGFCLFFRFLRCFQCLKPV